MRIARLPSGESRRKKRRRRENEARRRKMRGLSSAVKPEMVIKPARLARGKKRFPEVPPPRNDFLDQKATADMGLPSQKKLFAANIRLLHQVEIIFSGNGWNEEIDVRTSMIQDIGRNGFLYLAQTSPPVLASDRGREVELSFLSRFMDVPGGRWLRAGYATHIEEMIPNYRLSKRLREHVIKVPQPESLGLNSVRLAYRIIPPNDLDLNLSLWSDGSPLGLMDISAGGAQFYHDNRWYFHVERPLKLVLSSGRLRLVLESKVVRTGKAYDHLGREKGVTSVVFSVQDPAERTKFIKLLTEVYRHMLAKRSGVKPQPPK